MITLDPVFLEILGERSVKSYDKNRLKVVTDLQSDGYTLGSNALIKKIESYYFGIIKE